MRITRIRGTQNIPHEIEAISENELRQVAAHVFMTCTTCQIAQGHHFEHELRIRYVHHYAILTAKTRYESPAACGSVVTYESASGI